MTGIAENPTITDIEAFYLNTEEGKQMDKDKIESVAMCAVAYIAGGIASAREKLREQKGLETLEWVFLGVGMVILLGVVIGLVTGWVNGQLAKLPG